MKSLDDRYQSPAFEEASTEALRLTKEEWRYAAKEFVVATLCASFIRGAWYTWQTTYALRAFSAEARVAGIMAVSAIRHVGAVNAMFGVCIALFLVVHRRTKLDAPPPKHGFFWPMFLAVPLVAPISGVMMTCLSVLILSLVYEQGFAIAWKSILNTFVPSDASIGMLLAASLSIIYAAIGAELARWVARMHQWRIVTYIAAWFVTGLSANLPAAVLMPIIYADELRGMP